MTIGDATHVTSAKPHHAALQRQALRPRALATQQSACTEPAIPNRSPISPVTASKTHAAATAPEHQPPQPAFPIDTPRQLPAVSSSGGFPTRADVPNRRDRSAAARIRKPSTKLTSASPHQCARYSPKAVVRDPVHGFGNRLAGPHMGLA
jgi:hypothetical protein